MPQIRPYRATDRASAEVVFYRAVRIGAAAHYSAADLAVWAKSPEPDWTTPDKLLTQWCFVAHEGDGMTGFFSMDAAGYLDMAFVLPEVMGNGTAAALYDTLMAHARAQGLTRFTVRAAEQSRRFLARRGWQMMGVERLDTGDAVFQISLMVLDDHGPRTAPADPWSRVLRAYSADDRAALALVRYRAIRDGSASEYSPAARAAWAPTPDPDWTAPDKFLDQFCFVSLGADQMTGFMAMDRAGFLTSAYVVPQAMGDGTADLLYDRVTLAAREAGLTRFTAHAVEASRRLLARHGWQHGGMQEFRENGHGYSVNLMSFDLGTP